MAAMIVLSSRPPNVGLYGDVSNSRGMPRVFQQVGASDGYVLDMELSSNGGLVAKLATLASIKSYVPSLGP